MYTTVIIIIKGKKQNETVCVTILCAYCVIRKLQINVPYTRPCLICYYIALI